jgi:hypothetical protein
MYIRFQHQKNVLESFNVALSSSPTITALRVKIPYTLLFTSRPDPKYFWVFEA